MIKHLLAPLIFTSLILTGCQSPQGKFTPEQVAAMQSYGFTESAGDWSLGLSDAILFAKNDYKLLPESQQQIQTMAAKLASTGLTHARMDGHTDNYGEDSYNEVKWFTEFGHLNRGDMLTSEQHRCHNEKKKFQRRV